ncbi:hypothetical protein DMUE_2802 [Dictyocoela muelleri]|nr:hypothetical protein DMUE_2802 [Dictyocoela muelleri]
MLEKIYEQDLFVWKDEFMLTIKVANWDDPTALGVLKISISSEYIDLIYDCIALEDMMNAIFNQRYPREKQLKYKNKLFTIQQDDYRTIKEYRHDIIKSALKLGICMDWTREQIEMKIDEGFYTGLSKRTKLEMIRLNVQTTSAIYNLINATEEILIEQEMIKSKGDEKQKKKKRYPKNTILHLS